MIKAKSHHFLNSSFGKDIKFSALFGGGIALFLLAGFSTFAAVSRDTAGPAGAVAGGSFIHWVQEILIDDALPTEGESFSVHDDLENPTVKNSRRLADQSGSIIATPLNQKIGIGTGGTQASQLLEIKENTPRILLSSPEDPQLKLLASNGTTGKIFFNKTNNTIVFSAKGQQSIEIDEQGKANAKGKIKENGITLVSGNQKCPIGLFVRGFDSTGTIKCL